MTPFLQDEILFINHFIENGYVSSEEFFTSSVDFYTYKNGIENKIPDVMCIDFAYFYVKPGTVAFLEEDIKHVYEIYEYFNQMYTKNGKITKLMYGFFYEEQFRVGYFFPQTNGSGPNKLFSMEWCTQINGYIAEEF